jgi:hypothetical protein
VIRKGERSRIASDIIGGSVYHGSREDRRLIDASHPKDNLPP